MDSLLHRIEALPAQGHYALTFHRSDGGEQTVVAQVDGDSVQAAESGLPAGWTSDSDAFAAATRAVLALHASRQSIGPGATLRDVAGGWDVGLGNVVLGDDGVPECSAHGPMSECADIWICSACDAQALLS